MTRWLIDFVNDITYVVNHIIIIIQINHNYDIILSRVYLTMTLFILLTISAPGDDESFTKCLAYLFIFTFTFQSTSCKIYRTNNSSEAIITKMILRHNWVSVSWTKIRDRSTSKNLEVTARERQKMYLTFRRQSSQPITEQVLAKLNLTIA